VEKRKPSHDLERFKAVAGDPARLAIVQSAFRTAQMIGFDADSISATVKTMTRSMFFKSMTSYDDSRQWQDVYHVPIDDGRTVYLKFRDDIVTEFTILSFKEK
jgi:motility quorum-sensing regulator/GCU-specific mRNA interferase toxin